MRAGVMFVLASWVACSNNPAQAPTLTLAIGCSFPTDAGIEPCTDAPVPYVPGGLLSVDVTATPADPFTIAATASLRASIQIDSPLIPVGATEGSTASLVPDDAGTYRGAGALAWPPGGVIDVHVQVGGVGSDQQLMLVVPVLTIVPQPGTENGTSATVPVCIESTSVSGTVAVHLDGATLFTGTATDQSFTLELTDCLGSPGMTHVAFTATTTAAAFVVTGSLTAPTATAPPLFVTLPTSIPSQISSIPVIAVTGVNFDQPTSVVHAAGEAVTVEAVVTGSNGTPQTTVTFSSSPAVAMVPMAGPTNGSGKVSSTFSMPDLMGGSLVIGATAGTVTGTTTLTN